MDARDFGKYGAIYVLANVVLTISLTAIAFMIAQISPKFSLSGAYYGIYFGAAYYTYQRFVRSKGRLATPPEYWALVLLSTALMVAIEVAKLLLAYRFSPVASDIGFWMFALGIAAVAGLLVNMFSFSNWLGTRLLKSESL